jgi:hypothetical protein
VIITDEMERVFWERAALEALPVLLAEKDATVEEAVAMAVDSADGLLEDYLIRFHKPTPEEEPCPK